MSGKLTILTTLHKYDTTKQVIDLSKETNVVYSQSHPRKGTTVNTQLFVRALREYVRNTQSLRRACGCANTVHPTNFVLIDSVLEIYTGIVQNDVDVGIVVDGIVVMR